MKILQINATYGIGSTGRNVMETHRYLEKNGHESYVAWGILTTERKNENIFRVGNLIDHKWHALMMRITGKQGYYSRCATKKLCKKIESIQPDIIHLHNLHSNYICLPILLNFLADRNYPVAITLHDCWFFTGGCYHFVMNNCDSWKENCDKCKFYTCQALSSNRAKMFQVKADAFRKISCLGVIGVSDWITQEAKKSILKDSLLVQRIYNWIDQEIFKPVDTHDIRQALEIGNKKVVLGISQAWSRRKGLDEMLHLAEELIEEAIIILIGSIDKKIKLPQNVRALGYVKDAKELAQYYSLADVYANPSGMETFGKVSAEAMSCGTPVVVYNNTANKELVRSGCGLVAQNENTEDFVKCVRQILSETKARYTGHCISHANQEFHMEKQLAKYCEFYTKLLRGREERKTDE